MDISLTLENWDLFARGVWTTLELTFLSLLFGFLIALPCALSIWRKGPGHRIARGYAYVFRGTPLLVQTYLIYYGLAQLDIIRETWAWVIFKEAWWCALIAFSLNSGAYATEILRGAFQTTPKGELEAGAALGFTPRQITWLVLLPSAMRRAMPQYSNEIVFMLHGSVVASVITIQDILGAGRTLNAKYYVAYEGFLTAAALYMTITFTLIGIFRLLEKRYMRHMAPPSHAARGEREPDAPIPAPVPQMIR